MTPRAAYQNLWNGLVPRYAQCTACDRLRATIGGLASLTKAGWSWSLGRGGLRFRCGECGESKKRRSDLLSSNHEEPRSQLVSNVAALYVDPLGPYPKLVEHWYDEARDARTYAGPWPVVAHPPCGAYCALRHLRVPNRERRDDADCGPIAVEQVRRFGGVLEQPAGSKLWERCGLPLPFELGDEHGGYSLEVCQVEWGHVARKRTWLYVVGARPAPIVPPFRGRQPTHWVSGGRLHSRKGSGGVVPPGIKVCSAQQRRRTPVAFGEWLISLAAMASRRSAA